MAKKRKSTGSRKKAPIVKLLNFTMWLTGIVVSLSVGFAMIGGVLSLPSWLGGETVAMIAGWVVIISTFLGVLAALLNK